MSHPLVTVCITTFNRWHLLPLTVEGVCAQTHEALDIVVVDDCSETEAPPEVVARLEADPRIRLIRHPENRGLAAARNTAIEAAKGSYFTFCDDDDLWLPEYVAHFVEVAETRDDSWCYYCGSVASKFGRRPTFEGTMREAILAGYTPPVASQFYVTSTLRRCSGYDERIASGVDHDLWLSLAAQDANLKAVPAELSQPNAFMDPGRMTHHEGMRRVRIMASLDIWRPKIVATFGEAFYAHFRGCYVQQLDGSFFVKSLRRMDLRRATSILYQTDYKGAVIMDALRIMSGKVIGPRQRSRPLFAPFVDGGPD